MNIVRSLKGSLPVHQLPLHALPDSEEKHLLPPLDHLAAMTDDVGIFQHAVRDIPDRSHGYCTDDVSRAFMLVLRAAEHERYHEEAMRLAAIYLAFLYNAQLPDGRFRNFMSYDRRWIDNTETEDACGRAMWALGYGMRFAPRESWRRLCADMFARARPMVEKLHHMRSLAYSAIGLSHAYIAHARLDSAIAATLREIVSDFTTRYHRVADAKWDWFEDQMTYDNARLCEALLRAGNALGDDDALHLGLRTLRFYESVVFESGIFVPIGNAGWYKRGGKRARYAQQPLEAAAMLDVELFAESLEHDVAPTGTPHRYRAEEALGWFRGRNTRSVDMRVGGGCRDGLEEFGVNQNMGAESTLAYLWSAFAFAETKIPVAVG